MPNAKRLYQSPRLTQYGDLITLTKGATPGCPVGMEPAKFVGSGDDLEATLPLSPWTCVPV